MSSSKDSVRRLAAAGSYTRLGGEICGGREGRWLTGVGRAVGKAVGLGDGGEW